MIVQFNTDHNVDGKADFRVPLTALITKELERFSGHLTRVEVYLSDQDGNNKNGQNDKRCLLEARIKGRQPIATANNDDSYQMAVEGAITKMKTSLDSIIKNERLR